MKPFLRSSFANPSSRHAPGQDARAAIERARQEAARLLGCDSSGVVFTGGASEANNTVVRGAVRLRPPGGKKPHLVVSMLEHESVSAPAREMEERGIADVSWIRPGADGIVRAEDVLAAVQKRTMLVSLAYANSVLGTIQPVAEVGKALRERKGAVLFHTDIVQALPFLSCRPEELCADLMTASAHKAYGPKGVGILYVRPGIALEPLVSGGGQESGMRAGTENVPGIVGAGAACSLLCHHRSKIAAIRMRHLRDRLVRQVLRAVPGSALLGSLDLRLPNNAYFLFEGVRGSDLAFLLDRRRIAVSVGSACSERTEELPPALLAVGLPEDAEAGIRVTLGKGTTKEDAERAGREIAAAVARLRSS